MSTWPNEGLGNLPKGNRVAALGRGAGFPENGTWGRNPGTGRQTKEDSRFRGNRGSLGSRETAQGFPVAARGRGAEN